MNPAPSNSAANPTPTRESLAAISCSESLLAALRNQVEFYGRLIEHLDGCLKTGDRPDEFWMIAAIQLAHAVALDAVHQHDDTDRIEWLESQFPFMSEITLKICNSEKGRAFSVAGAIDAARFPKT
jgi:hypothetical protein